jgi:hypothetical protein
VFQCRPARLSLLHPHPLPPLGPKDKGTGPMANNRDKAKPFDFPPGAVIANDSQIMPPVSRKIPMPGGAAAPLKSAQQNSDVARVSTSNSGLPKNPTRG